MPGPDPERLRGLYAITPDPAPPDLPDRVAQALAGGARLVQYRDKSGDPGRRLDTARVLARLCHKHQALFIVNDDPALALACNADGVHLGRDDPPLEEARRLLGPNRILGVSCYADLERAAALASQADYLAFGRFFPSRTKPDAVQAGPDLLREAGRLGRPLVAIGGITAENGGPLVAAGAQMLAVVEAVFGARDVRAAAAALSRLFPEEPP